MITILVGDDTAESRARFVQLKENRKAKGAEVVSVHQDDVKNVDTLTKTSGLFADRRAFFIENVLSKKINRDVLKQFDTPGPEPDIIIWEEAVWESHARRMFRHGRVEAFSLPSNIFKLLDAIYPGGKVVAISRVRKVCDMTGQSIVMRMVQKRVRALILCQGGYFQKGTASWQKSRLVAQTEKWKLSRLLSFYETLYRIEYKTKQSMTVFDLGESLEIALCYYL